MRKLNDLINGCNVTAYGFKAFMDLAEQSNPSGDDVVISTLSPAIMMGMGIDTYFAPALPRGAVYNTPEEVTAADLSVDRINVSCAPQIESCDHVIIVSRHPGTVEILKDMYPDHTVMDAVTPETISHCSVVGTLPPALIQYADRYTAVTIKDFDYSKDGDLSGEELRERMVISDTITVGVVPGGEIE